MSWKKNGSARERTGIRLAAWVVCGLLAALLVPSTALAENGYGLTYVGQSKCAKCHKRTTGFWQVGTYFTTAHGQNWRNVEASGGLEPAASDTSLWPSPLFGTGTLRFGPDDITYMMGSPGKGHRFVTKYFNTAPVTLSTGSTLATAAGPADDLLYFTARFSDEGWVASAGKSGALMQACGPCHFTGVARPLQTTYTLGNGHEASRTTETTWSDFGITCEICHATGEAVAVEDSHGYDTGVTIVDARNSLKSDTCGQCHLKATSKEKNYSNGSLGNPNGFTPNQSLASFVSSLPGSQYVRSSSASPTIVIPTSDASFYPTGHFKGHGHGGGALYNEWMLSGHAQSLRRRDNGGLFISRLKATCLSCHSGEAYLQRIGYGENGGGNALTLHESTLASDTLNIECGICHTVHAQTGEALGLRMEGDELCDSCHTASITPGGALTPGQTVKHDDKEMVHGYGLIGVSGEPFMGNATCVDCHMPDVTGNASHRFTPMLPGDAEEWGVEELGDSCTPCHASKSRADLQADLDGWAADLATASAEASAAYAAASARTASATVPGSILIGAAKSNRSFCDADPSGGAHNFPFVMAGYEKAVFFADAVGASFARFGATKYDTLTSTALVYGTLQMGTGAPATRQTVTIEGKANGASTWAVVGTATTGGDGKFGFLVEPAGTTDYRARWTALDETTTISSATARVYRYSTTTLRASRSGFRLGGYVGLSGAVAPNHAGRTVTVYVKRGAGRWSRLSTRTLGSTSAYSFYWRPPARATFYVKTVFSGDSSHVGSTSPIRTVRVY